MAAPHAAGIFALMKGLHPDITPERVRSFIEAGVITQEMGDEGFDTLSGYGLLDAEKAINVALDDAAGTFRFPARFVLSDDELYFTEVMTAELVITNTGEIPADVSEVTSSETWVTVERLDEQEDDAVGRWSIAVNGEGLEAGFYSSDVRFVGVDEEGTEVVTTFKARLRIGKDGVGDVGVISVVLLSADSLAEVNSTIIQPIKPTKNPRIEPQDEHSHCPFQANHQRHHPIQPSNTSYCKSHPQEPNSERRQL